MIKVKARAFFRTPYRYLKELPIVVTIRNKNAYLVEKYIGTVKEVAKNKRIEPENVTTSETAKEETKLIMELSKDLCKHGFPLGLCKFGCKKKVK